MAQDLIVQMSSDTCKLEGKKTCSMLVLLTLLVSLSLGVPTPFKVNVQDSVLEDLQKRLELARYPDSLQDDKNWTTGTDLNYLKSFVEYWKTKYNWRQQEEKLNQMPQFTTTIGDQVVHFVHARSKYPNAKPLLMVHGWPGSFFEFSKILPMLLDPVPYGGTEEDAFHVVSPTIPGYGFSSAPTHLGFDQIDTAKLFIQLMKDLSYGEYWVQGGDWGAIITGIMAYYDPNIIGYHTNFPLGFPAWRRGAKLLLKNLLVFQFPSFFIPKEEMPFFERSRNFFEAFSVTGYMHLQMTKPQTLGYALNDSPVGLAAWFIEKFHKWGDCQGDIESVFTKDELITNIMLYWVTGKITSSARFYYEMINGRNNVFDFLSTTYFVSKPTGIANFLAELNGGVRVFAESYYNIQHWSLFTKGGHFAAMEVPQILAKDIWAFRRVVEKSLKQSTQKVEV